MYKGNIKKIGKTKITLVTYYLKNYKQFLKDFKFVDVRGDVKLFHATAPL